ncbi:hypothetical protein [Methanosphaera sp. WGK6]|uniref:hypothetical protein n=1 Tax=Methanosphaera sp. WGK6 TaxID=1561964 RepID=UPI00084CB48D|nr:hypothetical protein [Methanosphaera sp. WGK6]OED29486.1 hypothetical protein NL43_08000 [Methanosphaera sp. WGK6]
MTIVEKSREIEDDIKTLFELNLVVFEQTVLVSKNLIYSICHVPQLNVYDVVIEDKIKGELIVYQTFAKLSNSTLKYFNLLRDETYLDGFGNDFKCISHVIEYNIY